MSKSDHMTTEQAQLLQHLVAGKSLTEAATLLGINRRTAQRWLDLPHVAAAYAEISGNVSAHIRELVKAQIEQLSSRAIEALEESLDSPSHLAKIQAIKMVLDRVAPEEAKALAPAQQEPLQGILVQASTLPYITNEELDSIERIVALAEQRKAQAESDREVLERKRM